MQTAFYNKCLKKELDSRIAKNHRYSLRSFAKTLGINAGALSQILSGSRHPSYKMAMQMLKVLPLDPSEQAKFLSSLSAIQKSRNLKRLGKAFQKSTFELSAPVKQTELSFELFKIIADWHHYAILEMTFMKGFKSSTSWIAKKLGITEIQAKLAVDRLQELELIEKNNDGVLKKTDGRITIADRALSAPALRRRQKQILEKSIYSLENDPIETRNHSALTMAIDPKKLPEAKRRILEFNRELCRFLEDGNRTHVYEMQVSLFPLTQGEKNEEV